MNSSAPKISVIIRCHNEEKHIGKLLVGLSQQSLQDFEIIIVDSGSTDDTLLIAGRFPCRIVSIRPEEFSFGRALNRGCAAARGEFLVFASAHVYPVYNDWLDGLIKPFNNPRVAASYGKQRGNDVTHFSEEQIFRHLYPEESRGVQETPFCNNANCAVRASLWREMPYDEELTGLEDLHWGKRVTEKGFAIAYAADAEIIHVHEEKPKQILNRYRREAIALKRIYPGQHMSFGSFIRLFVFNTLGDYWHAARDGVALREILQIPLYRFLQFWGAYLGDHQEGSVTASLRKTFYYPRTLRRSQHTGQQRQPHREKIKYESV